MKRSALNKNPSSLGYWIFCLFMITSCKNDPTSSNNNKIGKMKEKQITFSQKNHALDNNDNFSPDGKDLCYDTRGTVFNSNLANCKSIEKVEIATGKETVLWQPEFVTGEQAAPGVAAVSYHPIENKVVFIHGPLLEEVEERGYYDIRNRTGVIVSADGKGEIIKADLRDISLNKPTIPGAQRGGTHRHEYSRDGERIGFTYDDILQQDYDRTIGYMENNVNAPNGYSHYFTVLLKPAKKGESKPGEIEKAYADSWVDRQGKKRAFIGKVRAKNGVDFENSLFVAEISDNVDITSAFSGTKDEYPSPPKGIVIKRLTHSTTDDGIVRGSYDGKKIAYLSEDKNGIRQVFVIPSDGSDQDQDKSKHPVQVSNFESEASNVRWHTSNEMLFCITNGNIAAIDVGKGGDFGKTKYLTQDNSLRYSLVVSPDGKMLAYNKDVLTNLETSQNMEDSKKEFMQIFVLEWDEK